MKIIMVGPVYPYSTGLSYYTGLMFQNLKEHHDVEMVSYKMQYPKLLFKRKQVDYEDDAVKVEEAKYWINTANPFNWISVAGKINKMKPDLVIFQWLHPYFGPCFFSLASMIRKAKIMYICHNVLPHERFPMDKLITKVALKTGDYLIAHSQKDKKDAEEMLPKAKCRVNVHPAYNFFKMKDMSRSDAREELGLKENQKVLLFFGLIREYKGLKHLLNAMPDIVDGLDDVKLLIAGEFCEDENAYLDIIKQHNLEDYIDIYGKHLPTNEVEKFFAACDLVVLPYESATQSGVIQVAYSFDKAVVATRVGGLPDVVEDGKTGYVVSPFQPKEIAEAVKDFFDKNRSEEFSEGIKDIKYKYSWDKMRDTIESFYKE